MIMIQVALLGTYFICCLMMNALIGGFSYVMAFSVVTTSSIQAENLLRLDILDTVLSEIQNYYQNFIDANPGGVGYTVSKVFDETSTLTYNGQEFILHDNEGYDLKGSIQKESIQKGHDLCLNKKGRYGCQGCHGRFLGYSSAHNCNGKAVSCCKPLGQLGEHYGCVCYSKKQAVRLNLGAAGCCNSQ